jgi:gliding motility associated protien GldN
MGVLRSYRLTFSAALVLTAGSVMAQGNPNLTDQPQTQTATGERVNATWQPSLAKDGVYDRTPHISAVLQNQAIYNERDVMYQKRVWREIDTRQKQNVAFRYPGDDLTGGGMFIEILLDALKKGKIMAYSTADDRFTTPLTKDAIIEMTQGKTDTTWVTDPMNPDVQTMQITHRDFNPDLITRFRLKEDWIFDRNLGRMVVRIIGLAPMMDKYSEEDNRYLFSYAMFWLPYQDLRPILAQYEVFNPENDVARMNWDEFFENRYFASYIIKVSNPFDKNFNQMGLQGTDALYEGQRVSEDLFNKEHDMWVY